jgi:hypothetical protein
MEMNVKELKTMTLEHVGSVERYIFFTTRDLTIFLA